MVFYPVIENIQTSGPALTCFESIAERPFSFFLDSGMDPQKLGRFSFMGSEPFLVFRNRGNTVTILRDGKEETRHGNPFDILGEYLEKYRLVCNDAPVPFIGGAAGYFSYDMGRLLEHLPSTASDDLQLPDCCLGFYDVVAAFDHLEDRAWIISSGFPLEKEPARLERARAQLDEMRHLLQEPHIRDNPVPSGGTKKLRGNFTHAGYLDAVERAREYICAGDIFEVNLSQRFDVDLDIPPWELYKRLRAVNPAPFASYFNFDDVAVVGASPERFMKVTGDRVETRPIKGTRPRGRDARQDKALAEELVTSTKDRAENIMIVDLERNDIGRVCRYGTVKVTELAVLETYPTVFHLTSTVVGNLQPGRNIIDLLKASFPGGSITGAPKVRAMEIIEELEPTRRGIYTGSLGYIGFNGDMDLNIVIRTIVVKNGKAWFQAGGAVVYDSVPESEYIETLDKGRAMMRALGLAEGAENAL